jgi:16S rRNA G527 N7-methylase RsmG
MSFISSRDRAIFASILPIQGDLSQFDAFFDDISEYIFKFLELNEQINLTSIRDPNLVLWKHFFDSLLPSPYLPAGNLLDWGAGGGFPSVPLAFYRKHFTDNKSRIAMLDSTAKKLNAIASITAPFSLNLDFIHSRGESFKANRRFEAALFRAVGPPVKCLSWLSNEYPNWFFYISPEQKDAWELEFSNNYAHSFDFKYLILPNLPLELGSRALIKIKPRKKH